MSEPLPPPLPEPPSKYLALALVLAFLPSVFALGLLAARNAPSGPFAACCVAAAIMSPACCVVSSVMLFRRRTVLAMVFAVLLGLVNLAISLGLGCAAILADVNSR